MGFLFKDAEFVRKQIEAIKALYPETVEDAELLADTLEGETDLEIILTKLVDFVREAESMADAVKARKEEISERQKRFERQGESGRKIIQQLMGSAQKVKMVLPEATLSILPAREKINIVSANDLPQGFFRTERKPLTKEILAAFKEGQPVPGAELVMSETSLRIGAK